MVSSSPDCNAPPFLWTVIELLFLSWQFHLSWQIFDFYHCIFTSSTLMYAISLDSTSMILQYPGLTIYVSIVVQSTSAYIISCKIVPLLPAISIQLLFPFYFYPPTWKFTFSLRSHSCFFCNIVSQIFTTLLDSSSCCVLSLCSELCPKAC